MNLWGFLVLKHLNKDFMDNICVLLASNNVLFKRNEKFQKCQKCHPLNPNLVTLGSDSVVAAFRLK